MSTAKKRLPTFKLYVVYYNWIDLHSVPRRRSDVKFITWTSKAGVRAAIEAAIPNVQIEAIEEAKVLTGGRYAVEEIQT